MPIYDYSCTSCRHLVEVIHGIHDPGPRFCPACGAEGGMRKGFSTPAVHFKGSGWAKKDRSSSSSSANGSASKTPALADSNGSSAGGADHSADAGSGASTETKKSATTTSPVGGD
ncbi:MAG: zinc ribbon domain-containing protein [Candidatus Limnocylindrales bacterium]